MKRFMLSLVLLMLFATVALAKVNINTASVDELKEINGIGPAKAEAIVKYREEHGNFKSKEDIIAVKGIGEKLYTKISEDIEIEK